MLIDYENHNSSIKRATEEKCILAYTSIISYIQGTTPEAYIYQTKKTQGTMLLCHCAIISLSH